WRAAHSGIRRVEPVPQPCLPPGPIPSRHVIVSGGETGDRAPGRAVRALATGCPRGHDVDDPWSDGAPRAAAVLRRSELAEGTETETPDEVARIPVPGRRRCAARCRPRPVRH